MMPTIQILPGYLILARVTVVISIGKSIFKHYNKFVIEGGF